MNEYPTPSSQEEVETLQSGVRHQGVTVTFEQYEAIAKLYGLTSSGSSVERAARQREAFRYAEHDGLRVLAFLAGFMEPGDDPVKAVVRLAVDAGWDVQPADAQWAEHDL